MFRIVVGLVMSVLVLCPAAYTERKPRFTATVEIYRGCPNAQQKHGLPEENGKDPAVVCGADDLRKAIADVTAHGLERVREYQVPIDLDSDTQTFQVWDERTLDYFVPLDQKEAAAQAAPDTKSVDRPDEGRIFELRAAETGKGTQLFLQNLRIAKSGGKLTARMDVLWQYAAVGGRKSLGRVPLDVGEPKPASDSLLKVALEAGVGAWWGARFRVEQSPSANAPAFYVFIKIDGSRHDAADAVEETAKANAAGPQVTCTVTFKAIEVLHQLGDDALTNVRPVAGAQRLEGDAVAFLGQQVQLGDMSIGLADGRVRYTDGRPEPSDKESPIKIELISAPRITVGPIRKESYKVLSTQDKGSSLPLFPANDLLYKDIESSFLKREPVPNVVALQPAIIADTESTELPVASPPYFEHLEGKRYVLRYGERSSSGILCGVALTLDNDKRFHADFLFRFCRDLGREPAEGTSLPVGKPRMEFNSFRYLVPCAPPGESIGFAYPLHGQGHMCVLMTIDKVTDTRK